VARQLVLEQEDQAQAIESAWLPCVVIGLTAAAMFAVSVTDFQARPIDLSARRLLEGGIPYRDFWTMYAPGSFTVLAGAFWLFGRELIVSNILGLLTAAASVAACCRVTQRVAPPFAALAAALLYAVAFLSTPYHNGFTSFPPASLLSWLAVASLAGYIRRRSPRRLIAIGLYLGFAMLFKHDVAGYACLAAASAILAAPGAPIATRIRAVAGVASIVAVIAACAVAVIWALGAWPDMVRDLIVFPLTDFRYVRPEHIPLFPPFGPFGIDLLRGWFYWALVNLPLYAAVLGVIRLWTARHRIQPERVAIVTFAAVNFALVWNAAHVQLNTHIVSMTGLGALLCVAGVFARPIERHRTRPLLIAGGALAAIWIAVMLAEPGAKFAISASKGRTWVGLPHLRGITAAPDDVVWMRELAAAIEAADRPDTPLLMLANRNDVVVHAEGFPYWLSDRAYVTRHHELHPGITDTLTGQREMLEDIGRVPPPVVVREYRFNDATLETMKQDFLRHVAVGAPLLDDWIARNYGRGRMYGRYELLRRHEHPGALPSTSLTPPVEIERQKTAGGMTFQASQQIPSVRLQ
jgi:hypothetical protein